MKQKVRLLRPEEAARFQFVQAVAFETEYDYEEEKKKAVSNQEKDTICRKIGVFSEDESVLYGCLLYNRYRCAFDGRQMLLGGVGGVATLPQYRRNGIIRTCMNFTLRDMYEQGYAFSFLYPFSMQYYRQFGYEAANTVHKWTIPFAELQKRSIEGKVEQIFPGDCTEPLLEIYQKFYQGYNLSSICGQYREAFEKENLLKQKRYVFLYRNAKGEPRGFFTYRKKEKEDGTVMDCTPSFASRNDFLFLDTQAFWAMLSFIKTAFGSYYTKIQFGVPADIPLTNLVGENNMAQCERFCGGMVRVVNVQKVLEMCRCKGNGELCMEIHDSILLENHGVWKISFAEGKDNRVEKMDGSEKADITLPVNAFSALICGEKSAADITWMPNVEVHAKEMELHKIFYQKKCHIADLF